MYLYFALMRCALIFLPFMGYIHPDEFFQTTEVIAGNILKVESKLAWEFNTTNPIRSMALPYFTIGLSYKLLLAINTILKMFLTTTIFTTYFVVIFPRLLMCASSFIVDYSLFKICKNNNEKFSSRLIILASSYIVSTYATRTFTNSFELFLFSLLLYYVSESLTFSNQILRKKEYVQYRYNKTKSIPEKAKFHKLNLYLKTDSLRNCFEISTIVVVGFFNRPTFLAFSVIPVFFWLYRGIGSTVISNLYFHLRILSIVICSLPSLILIIIVDSFYYGFLTWGEIGMLDISINNFVFTPWNFIKYNMDVKNLSEHGIHPRYLHLLISMPLLFNLLTFFHLHSLTNYFHRLTQSKFNLLPTVRSIKGLMTLSTITPLFLLSFFPHQEPRFLIPLLLPMVYLYGNKILSEEERDVIKAEPNSIKRTDTRKTTKYLYITWLIINFILLIFYGFLHQGGVTSAMSKLSKISKGYDKSVTLHVFSSHNYMLPESLLLQNKQDSKLEIFNEQNKLYKKRIQIYEEGSNDLGYLIKRMSIMRKALNKNSKIYLLVPNTLKYITRSKFNEHKLNFIEIDVFYPHISIEAFYGINDFYFELSNSFNYEFALRVFKNLSEIVGLGLYEIL